MLIFAGVRENPAIHYLTEELARILRVASVWSARNGTDVYVTSMNDHVHGAGSLHGEDMAVDFQTVGKKIDDLLSLTRHLRSLGPPHDIVYGDEQHKTHVHVEFDIKRRKR